MTVSVLLAFDTIAISSTEQSSTDAVFFPLQPSVCVCVSLFLGVSFFFFLGHETKSSVFPKSSRVSSSSSLAIKRSCLFSNCSHLQLKGTRELYDCATALANIVIPQVSCQNMFVFVVVCAVLVVCQKNISFVS